MAAQLAIVLYAKPGCGICESAKAKLALMGLAFEVRDLAQGLATHPGWREDGSVELLAASAMLNNAVPIVSIEGRYFDYAGAMRELKRRLGNA